MTRSFRVGSKRFTRSNFANVIGHYVKYSRKLPDAVHGLNKKLLYDEKTFLSFLWNCELRCRVVREKCTPLSLSLGCKMNLSRVYIRLISILRVPTFQLHEFWHSFHRKYENGVFHSYFREFKIQQSVELDV